MEKNLKKKKEYIKMILVIVNNILSNFIYVFKISNL